VGPVALGDVEARLSFFALLIGRARLSLDGADEDAPLEGAALVTRHGFGFEDVTGRFRLGALASPLAITTLDLQDVSAGFTSGRCTRAEGRVRAQVAGQVAGIGLASGLTGNARCASDALLLPLVSQSGMEQVNIRLFADGRYRLELLVRTSDAAIGARLAVAGFRPSGRGHVLRVDGSF
jgi:general secretion pathway protein N